MALYFFNLKEGRRTISDTEGTELPDPETARIHASEVARELMRHREAARRSWRLQVCDSAHAPLFELLFADADGSLDHLSRELRASLKDVYVKTGRLSDTIHEVRISLLQLKGTLARVDRTPWLAAVDGRSV